MSGSQNGLLNSVSSLPELLTQEINICTAQGEKKHSKDYFQTNISYQKFLFKESYLICLIHYWEGCDYYSIGIQRGIVDFLCPNIYWSDKEA